MTCETDLRAKRKGLGSICERAVEDLELGCSIVSASRGDRDGTMAELYACGAYERIYVKVNPRVTICYYRLKD